MTTEPHLIVADDIVAAWKGGYRQLRQSGNRFNLILHIRNPVDLNNAETTVLDPHRSDVSVDALRDVATTIFPKRSAHWSLPIPDFRAHYIKSYGRMLRRGRRSWGCYFLRMVDFGHGRADQLNSTIAGLSTWGSHHKAAFTIHLSSAETDRARPQGAPCLQYVQFLVNSNRSLCMTAVYRSHDYFGKALGNLVGLSRLLEFVAMHTGHEIGTLTCVSTYAFVDVSRAKADALMTITE